MTDEKHVAGLEKKLAAADAKVEKAIAKKEAAAEKVEAAKEEVRSALAERDPIFLELQEARRDPANAQVIGAGDEGQPAEQEG